MDQRKCEHCGVALPVNAHKLRIYCDRRCNQNAYYQRVKIDPAWRAKTYASVRAWQAANRDRLLAYQRDYQRRYRAQHPRTYKGDKRAAFARILGVQHG